MALEETRKSELLVARLVQEVDAKNRQLREWACKYQEMIEEKTDLDQKYMEVKKKMEEMSEVVKEKTEEMEHLEALNQVLIMKERKSNDQLLEAKKGLIIAFSEMPSGRTAIGIKRMGELDVKPFHNACKERFPKNEADVKAFIFCSKWQNELRNPEWHPLKVIVVDGKETEVIRDDDEKLQALKEELGDEPYRAVTKALLELNEYNANGRYPISEIWNFKEQRQATLNEAISYVLKMRMHNKRKQ